MMLNGPGLYVNKEYMKVMKLSNASKPGDVNQSLNQYISS